MAKTKAKPKKYKTRAAERRAELRRKGLPIPPPRTIFLPPSLMDLLTTREKRVYTKKYRCKLIIFPCLGVQDLITEI
ncbi:hypothetical protein BCIN_10g00220 [Botrytis cinerea B05.10]|uniref:Uncharacterized protein n=1 Tax=Botryotinia fuckeliana (strain B05.10) TaxID=332648 RepID=A0A384JTS9_BOTFB|nr:hypothetical protein BCIN_10g00220 [Botrytis cinerea B05.10]ATZ53995.1 hypothetical protein BCIN_10g00220 [Botrytis cinerea B05.10]